MFTSLPNFKSYLWKRKGALCVGKNQNSLECFKVERFVWVIQVITQPKNNADKKKKRERKRKRDQALGVIVTVGTWRDSKTRVFFYFAGIFKGFNLLRVTSSANLKMIKRKYKK